MTVLLSSSDIAWVLDVDEALRLLRAGFRSAACAPPVRVRAELPGAGSATALLPGTIDGIPAYTTKVNAKFPGARPALRGLVCLHDLADGALLAVLDSAAVTGWRTGLAAAVLSDALAGPDARSAGVIGAGVQASRTLAGLVRLRRVDELVVHDLDPVRADRFPRGPVQHVRSADSAPGVAGCADIIVVATWSREPLLDVPDVRAGAQVTALGADEPGKRELTAELLSAATLVVDDVDWSLRSGVLSSAGLGRDAVHATAREVLAGTRGRQRPGDVTVYAPIGMPWQDLAVAWALYRSALDQQVGREYDFLS